MFRTAIATYINTNLQKHGLSAKKVAAIAQIPDSTFSNYKTGKIEHPNEEQLFRIAAVFGDTEETIRLLRLESEDAAKKEEQLKADAKDKALLDQVAALIREGSVKLLSENAEHMEAQQEEMRRLAAEQIENERSRCAQEIKLLREHYEGQMALMERQYEARIADLKQYIEMFCVERPRRIRRK